VLNRTSIKILKANKLVIMFMLLMVLLVILAWWVADTLIEHLDQNMPGL